MQVLLTLGLIAALAGWSFVVVRKLAKMRVEVQLAWKRLETDQANEAVKTVYNKHVNAYNGALEEFPASLIGWMAGFKPARAFDR